MCNPKPGTRCPTHSNEARMRASAKVNEEIEKLFSTPTGEPRQKQLLKIASTVQNFEEAKKENRIALALSKNPDHRAQLREDLKSDNEDMTEDDISSSISLFTMIGQSRNQAAKDAAKYKDEASAPDISGLSEEELKEKSSRAAGKIKMLNSAIMRRAESIPEDNFEGGSDAVKLLGQAMKDKETYDGALSSGNTSSSEPSYPIVQKIFNRNSLLDSDFKDQLAEIDNSRARVSLNDQIYDGTLSVTNKDKNIPTLTFSSPSLSEPIDLVSDDYNNGYLHTFGGLVASKRTQVDNPGGRYSAATPMQYPDIVVEKLNEKFPAPKEGPGTHWEARTGRRYTKIVRSNTFNGEEIPRSTSVYMFVDNETGDFLYPAGFNAPARGARFSPTSGDDVASLIENNADEYGTWLRLRH